MRRPLLALTACVSLAACDSGGPSVCFVTPDASVSAHLVRPVTGDTLRLGEPFHLFAEFSGEGDVPEVGVRVLWAPPGRAGEAPDNVLFELPLAADIGGIETVAVERMLTVDSLRGGAPSAFDPEGQFYISAYGRARYSDCGGIGGESVESLAAVTILD